MGVILWLAVGDVNTYALFTELARGLISSNGRAGIIVPTGIATDDTTKDFFADLSSQHRLASLLDFENRAGLFPEVDSRFKFSLLTMSGKEVKRSEFAFFATRVEHLKDARRRFTLTPNEIELFNPNTRTMPLFRTSTDAELTRKIYNRVPILNDEQAGKNSWGAYYMRLVDLSDHAEAVRFPWDERGDTWDVPLYEAKLITSYDHRFSTFEGLIGSSYVGGQPRDVSANEKSDPDYSIIPRY